MALPNGLNDLAKLTLLASDESYFSPQFPFFSLLQPLPDTPSYNISPQYDIVPGLSFQQDFQRSDNATGFKVIAYKNSQTNEVIVAFGGTDGANPQDWAANVEHLGWNQWNGDNRTAVFAYLNSLDSTTKIHFTGQSLGGALAQYASYEYVRNKTVNFQGNTEFDSTFDKTRVSLTTFNAFGGQLALQRNSPEFDSTVLNGLGASAHFVIDGDLVSRLGGGHVGGPVYQLDYLSTRINPFTGQPYFLDLIEGHRIETGFYANLTPLPTFDEARPLTSTELSGYYLPMASVQKMAALIGNILNGKDVSPLESVPRLVAGLFAGMTFGDPTELDRLAKAVLANLHDSGKLSDSQYAIWNTARLPLAIVSKPFTLAITPVSLLAAGLLDALDAGLDSVQSAFSAVRAFFNLTEGPTAPVNVSQHELEMKARVFLASVPGALSASDPLAQELAALQLSPDEFAQQLLNTSGDTWRTETLAYLRDQLPNPADKVQSVGLAVAFYDTLSSTPDLDPSDLTLFAQEQDTFITDTASGFANAIADFTQKITNVAFNLGQTLTNFADIQLIDQAYAAELTDPRLPSSVRTVVEEARDIVQQAGQTVVVQQGIGANPFDIAGFNPDDAPLATGTVREEGANVFTAYLPYAAGTGGQAVQLKLNGLGANTVTVLTNGQELTPQNSAVTVIVPEGQQQLLFVLRAPDVSANTVLSVNAVLVNSAGTATHVEQQEATVSLVDSTITYDDGRPVLTITSLVPEPDNDHNYIFLAPDGWVGDIALKSGHDQIYGSSLGEFITGGYGHDRIDGGGGSDTILGGNYFLNQEPTPIPFEEADGDDMCWAATPMCWPSGILLGSVST